MKKLYTSLGVTVFALCISPSLSEAYFTTNQSVQRINAENAVLTVSYKFGHDDKDMYLPTTAVRAGSVTADGTSLTYGLYENGDDLKGNGVSQAVIISKAPVVDGMYKIAKGTVQTFTVLVLLSTNESELEADYALHVDALPFKIETDVQKLNPSELQYYATKEVELNTGNYPEKTQLQKQ